MRRAVSTVLFVLAAVAFPLGVVADWAHTTIFDSSTFSARSVSVLNSSAVRQQLAAKLTEQLAIAGYPQAVDFRPGLQLVIEAAVDTDTFRAIFRTSLQRAHAAVLAGRSGGGLDLSQSATLLTATAALSRSPSGGTAPAADLDNSLNGLTARLGRWGIWDLDSTVSTVTFGCLFGALLAAAAAVVLAEDRRGTVRRLGWAMVVDGATIFAGLVVAQWYLQRLVHDAPLSRAVGDAVWHGTADLRTVALWIAAYGLVIAAATASRQWRSRDVLAAASAWADRRRATTGGTILLGGLVLVAGVVLVQNPRGNVELLAVAAGLWLSYLGVGELLRLARFASARTRAPARRLVLPAAAVVVVLAVVGAALALSGERAAARADASGRLLCNGEASLCDLRLDQVIFPGTHNSMSSSLYPGYLFGEQIQTVKGQLDSGIRALLLDTHYGVPSTLRLPGSGTPVVLTDRAAELQTPAAEAADPAAAQRAVRMAERAPEAAHATRGIYLCHNYCELGAVPFSSVLGDLKGYLDSHPDDVVMTVIQDATKPSDTAAAIEAAGLGDRVATLQRGRPLPTLRSLVTSGRTLLVFAEQGGPGAPAWYQPAYDWFQETPFAFKSAADFTCRPNRGSGSNPLMLVNHWVTTSPPDPGAAAAVNARPVISRRIQTCIAQRGVVPTVVAVDFSEKGNLVAAIRAINAATLRQATRSRRAPRSTGSPSAGSASGTASPPSSVAPSSPDLAPNPAAPSLPTVPPSTTIATLTGGDPARFCAVLPNAVRSIVDWAETVLGEAPGDAGVTTLAYGPLLARDVGTYVQAAPLELAERARGVLGIANAAVATLRDMGLDDAAISGLADAGSRALAAPGNADGITVAADLRTRLQGQVNPGRLQSAGVVFSAGQPDPATVLDLGYVPPTLASASAFSACPEATATI